MIEQSTLTFLNNLKANNNREWFADHKAQYEQAKANVEALVAGLINLIAGWNPAVAHVQPKDCMFRIYRDVRFSPNKAPYKTNMGAYITPGGKKSLACGYYIHIEPDDQHFFGGGAYMPPATQLKMIRQEIDYHTSEFLAIIENPLFVQRFGKLAEEYKLKTAPKGYAKDHPHLPLLVYTGYVVTHRYANAQVCNPQFLQNLNADSQALHPMNEFLNRAMGLSNDQ